MPTRLTSTLLLSVALTTSACSSSMKTPDIKQNPHPTKRYEITLTIKDAPGPFDSVTGYMQYEVANEQCAPKDEFSGVHRKPPIQRPPIVFTRVRDNVYRGTVYLDLLQDENYHGLGVCHWAVIAAIARLKFHNVTFSPDISAEAIASQQSSTQYFWKESYLVDSADPRHESGLSRVDAVTKDPEKYFSITLGAKERFQ
jgi:hypothetical protein